MGLIGFATGIASFILKNSIEALTSLRINLALPVRIQK